MKKFLFVVFLVLFNNLILNAECFTSCASQESHAIVCPDGNIKPDDTIQDLLVQFNSTNQEMKIIKNKFKEFSGQILQEIDLEIALAQEAMDNEKILDLLKQKEDWEKHFQLMDTIACGDIQGLMETDPEVLRHDFEIDIEGEKFENNLDGRLEYIDISGDNMLAWAIFCAATNVGKSDEYKSLQVIEYLLQIGLDVNSCAKRSYFVKDDDLQGQAQEFGDELSLVEIAILYGSVNIVDLLLKYGAKFDKKRVQFCVYSRVISDLIQACGQLDKIEPIKFQKIKLMFVNFLDVLELLHFGNLLKDENGKDLIQKFDEIFCKYSA